MLLLELCYLSLALFDAWTTAKRLPQIGIEAECNTFIRWLTTKLGIKTGIYVGVLIPTLILMMFAPAFPQCFIFLTGMRTTLCAFQIRTMKAIRT